MTRSLPPIRRQLVVPSDAELAFAVFTGQPMTVIRLPGPAHLAELVRRAQDEDPSVARGLLLDRPVPVSAPFR